MNTAGDRNFHCALLLFYILEIYFEKRNDFQIDLPIIPDCFLKKASSAEADSREHILQTKITMQTKITTATSIWIGE